MYYLRCTSVAVLISNSFNTPGSRYCYKAVQVPDIKSNHRHLDKT